MGRFTKRFSTKRFTKKVKWILPLTLLIACSNNKHSVNNEINKVQGELRNKNQAMVVDSNKNPVAGASVTIGDKVVITDANGIFAAPATWTHEMPVTIIKDGFVKTSYLQQKFEGQVFEIHPRKSLVRYTVKGGVSGFGNMPADGYIDFALAVTSLDTEGVLNFDIDQLISTEYDTVSVMGQELDIPTNVFVPRQKENYSFLPVTIEKAFYRLFFDLPGTYHVQTNRGKFDFKKVADKLKSGKSFFEVVNDFQFLALGTSTVDVDQQNVSLNLDGNQKQLAPKIAFNAANPTNGMLFGVSLVEENGKFIPSDIKLKDSNNLQLSLPTTATKGKVLLINADKVQVNKDTAKLSDSMATTIVDSDKLNEGYLLERIDPPSITPTGMKLSKPNLKGKVKGFATYAALSDIQGDRSDLNWEIYSPGWVDSIDLPNVNDVRSNQQWHVVFYGIDSIDNKQFNGPRTLDQATHAVHNAVNF